MKMLIRRPRSLLLVAALAVTAATCSLSTANAASFASAASSEQAASSTPCNFVESLQACESTDPTAAYYDSASGDTSHCTFVFDVTWGDGGKITRTLTDPTAGHHLVGDHTYKAPGVYAITVTVMVTAGTCTGTDSVHTFTLLAPIYNDHYSGYVTPPGAYKSVSAVWTVPHLHCLFAYPPYGYAGAHQWIGLGGVSGGPPGSEYADVNATPLLQDGIVSLCRLGIQTNQPFWEAVPGNTAQYFSKKVEAGDQIHASVTYKGGGKYEMDLADTSKTHGWTAHAHYTAVDTREGTTAEWIIEPGRPSLQLPGFPNLTLADFGKVTLHGASYSTDAHHGIILGGRYSVTPVKFIQGTPRNPAVYVSPVNPGGEFYMNYLTKRHIK